MKFGFFVFFGSMVMYLLSNEYISHTLYEPKQANGWELLLELADSSGLLNGRGLHFDQDKMILWLSGFGVYTEIRLMFHSLKNS